MGRVEGKVVIVTGGATGIGRGISEILAREGAKVVIANRNEERGVETAKAIADAGGQAHFVPTDVAREADCKHVVQEAVRVYGKLDGLVNNAGIFPRATLEETTSELWDRIMAVNLKGPAFCCKYAVPEMRKQGGGSIVNIGSANGYIGGSNLFAYSISKGGLITLTRNLAASRGTASASTGSTPAGSSPRWRSRSRRWKATTPSGSKTSAAGCLSAATRCLRTPATPSSSSSRTRPPRSTAT
jgi:NAD(P)-dependent dehydrogenase (short-subunit alcohol dehydrogenase family)